VGPVATTGGSSCSVGPRPRAAGRHPADAAVTIVAKPATTCAHVRRSRLSTRLNAAAHNGGRLRAYARRVKVPPSLTGTAAVGASRPGCVGKADNKTRRSSARRHPTTTTAKSATEQRVGTTNRAHGLYKKPVIKCVRHRRTRARPPRRRRDPGHPCSPQCVVTPPQHVGTPPPCVRHWEQPLHPWSGGGGGRR